MFGKSMVIVFCHLIILHLITCVCATFPVVGSDITAFCTERNLLNVNFDALLDLDCFLKFNKKGF